MIKVATEMDKQTTAVKWQLAQEKERNAQLQNAMKEKDDTIRTLQNSAIDSIVDESEFNYYTAIKTATNKIKGDKKAAFKWLMNALEKNAAFDDSKRQKIRNVIDFERKYHPETFKEDEIDEAPVREFHKLCSEDKKKIIDDICEWRDLMNKYYNRGLCRFNKETKQRELITFKLTDAFNLYFLIELLIKYMEADYLPNAFHYRDYLTEDDIVYLQMREIVNAHRIEYDAFISGQPIADKEAVSIRCDCTEYNNLYNRICVRMDDTDIFDIQRFVELHRRMLTYLTKGELKGIWAVDKRLSVDNKTYQYAKVIEDEYKQITKERMAQ